MGQGNGEGLVIYPLICLSEINHGLPVGLADRGCTLGVKRAVGGSGLRRAERPNAPDPIPAGSMLGDLTVKGKPARARPGTHDAREQSNHALVHHTLALPLG